VAIAEAVAERLKGRQGSNQFKAKGGGNISTSFEDSGKTRDLAAAKAVAERLKGRAGNPKLKANSGNISPIEIGRTTDLAIAEAVAERLRVQAEHRMKAGKAPSGNISGGSDEAGKTRDLAAAKAVAERLKGCQLANLKQNRGGNISTSDDAGKTRDPPTADNPAKIL
jgi:hypothetical protein